MKKFLLVFLMFIMLTPGLACGPFMAAGKAQAAQSSNHGMSDCKDAEMGSQKETQDRNHTFFKDCSRTDLFSVDHDSLRNPDSSAKVFFTAWATATPEYSFIPVHVHAIRGPPPDWPSSSRTRPSVLLTTQRFRE